MHLALIGPGRLGRTLAQLWTACGHEVTLVGRSLQVPASADLRVLTVPDRAIEEVSNLLPEGTPVIHTSGATSLDPLKKHEVHGSFHPLMTFPGPELSIPELAGVPVALDGSPQVLPVLHGLAKDLTMRPIEVPGDRRLYHAAAVLSGNFATILLALGSDVLTKAGVPAEVAPSVLLPLALQSLQNAGEDPWSNLTGPLARGDEDVMNAHKHALSENGLEEIANLYDLMIRIVRRNDKVIRHSNSGS